MRKITVLLTMTVFVFAQTDIAAQKVWNNDRKAEFKADTSIVEIRGIFYKKIIAVSYEEVNEEKLQAEFDATKEAIRAQRRELNNRMKEDSIALAKLELELDMQRSFFKAARKDLKIAAKDADEFENERETKRQEQEQKTATRNALIQGNIVVNPRKKE